MYFRGMDANINIFKIETNNVLPSRGKILISEPFLRDKTFGRSVVLLIDHTMEGSMGLILNKPLPISLNDVLSEFKHLDRIPLFKGGPLNVDTLFYLHTLTNIEGSLSVGKGIYMNGNFDAIKDYILQGNDFEGKIRFFLGYSGWEYEQLIEEIKENTWLITKDENSSYMNIKDSDNLWKTSLEKLGGKYEIWSRFPQIPTMN